MMKRREFIALLGGAAAWPVVARGQQAERVRLVGILQNLPENDPVALALVAMFLKELQQLGWTVGSNISVETRWAGTASDDIRRHAAELVALAPDIILANGTSTLGQYDIWRKRNQFRRVAANVVRRGPCPTGFDRNIGANCPSQLLKLFKEHRDQSQCYWIILGEVLENADQSHSLGLLPARHYRPRRRAAEQRDELAPLHHSITSSAATCSVVGTVRPSALAACKLITSSNCVGRTTGRSLGCAPLRIRAT